MINTRQYRALEVILGLEWCEKSDVWAAGCILMELYGGELLFQTHEDREHLALIERTVARLPATMLLASSRAGQQQRQPPPPPPLLREWSPEVLRGTDDSLRSRVDWPHAATALSSRKYVAGVKKLEGQVMDKHIVVATLARRLLRLLPESRPSAAEALEDPFFASFFED
eukprot:TRINITY_DN33951_c0_g1_i2.p1 TRINITY_DN33951_c0_g1~~TRINITY_DN33951_c0_g1_i2.p1  ORF type:complete len:170 (-),score=42.88 TRINITY_DN33951_c0_g1_i2:104-613(-)